MRSLLPSIGYAALDVPLGSRSRAAGFVIASCRALLDAAEGATQARGERHAVVRALMVGGRLKFPLMVPPTYLSTPALQVKAISRVLIQDPDPDPGLVSPCVSKTLCSML